MKKLSLAVVMAILIAPFMSFAETTDSVMAEIEAIKVKRETLQQELIDLNRQERDLRLKLSELKHTDTATVASSEEKATPSFGAPVITKPLDGEIVPMTVDTVTVEGTAPEGTQKIIVNGYTLTKFVPGNQTWVYYASPRFSTMKEGPNFYTAVAVDKFGNKTVSDEMALYYGEPPQDEIEQGGKPVERDMAKLSPVRTYPYRSRMTNPAWESSDFSTLDRDAFSGNLERVYEQQKRANEKLLRYRNLH